MGSGITTCPMAVPKHSLSFSPSFVTEVHDDNGLMLVFRDLAYMARFNRFLVTYNRIRRNLNRFS